MQWKCPASVFVKQIWGITAKKCMFISWYRSALFQNNPKLNVTSLSAEENCPGIFFPSLLFLHHSGECVHFVPCHIWHVGTNAYISRLGMNSTCFRVQVCAQLDHLPAEGQHDTHYLILHESERGSKNQVKSECNTNFRKGNGSVIVDGSESEWRAASWFQRVQNEDVSETKWLRPVERRWHHSRFQTAWEKQVLPLCHSRRRADGTHSPLMSNTHQKGTEASQSAYYFPPLRVERTLWRSDLSFVVCGSRWRENTSITLSALCVWAARWWLRTRIPTP